MLKTKNIILATATAAMLSSCGNDFLELDPYQQIGDDIAIEKVDDIATAVTGVYYWMGSSSFLGRNLTALGDIASDNVRHTNATSHLRALYLYTYQPTTSEISNLWQVGYKIIDHSSRIIEKATPLLANATKADSAVIYKGLSQAYAMRGYATFALTNVFALPYSEANLQTQGVVLVEQPVQPFEKVSRATLGETYEYVIDQFEKAASAAQGASSITNEQFYMNSKAITAMQARVSLYKGDYEKAKAYAKQVIGNPETESRIATTVTAYNEMFDKLSGSAEDIFVIAKSNDDHLSANSLNTLYYNYGVGISDDLTALYADTDIRKQKLTPYASSRYFSGGKYAEDITNVPVIRLPEMYLIVAECEAMAGNVDASAAALYEVAKRNTAITSPADLPNTIDELKAFIVDERRRELFQEGHRLYDTRRLNETIYVAAGSKILENGIALYPIPADEINSGSGVEQTADWVTYRPKAVNPN